MALDKSDHRKIKDHVRTLILAGFHVDDIAEALGFSDVDDVRAIIDEVLSNDALETRDYKRQIENQRLEAIMAQYWLIANGKVEVTPEEQ